MYLAVLLDLCSKAVVGWAADTHMRTELVADALTLALTARRPDPGLIVQTATAARSAPPRTGSMRWRAWPEYAEVPKLLEGRDLPVIDGRRMLATDSLPGYDGVGYPTR